MTRKHVQRLANELAIQWDVVSLTDPDHTGFHRAVAAVVKTCLAANPRFDADRFRRAVYEGAKDVRI